MDLEGIILSEIKSDKDKSCMISFTCGMLKKEKKEKLHPSPTANLYQTHRKRSELSLSKVQTSIVQ